MVNNVRRDIRSHFLRAGFRTEDRITAHAFCKSFGQNLADAGTPIHVVQRLMGHASITTTSEFYLTAPDANERDALSRCEALLGAADGKNGVELAYEPGSGDSTESTEPITDEAKKT